MSVHTVKLLRREPVAQDTIAFHFERPARFAFKAGQAIDVVLPEVLDGAGKKERHAFSIVSAPFEDGIAIATRMRDSAYKRALAALAPGSSVEMHGPFGSLTLHGDARRPAVLVAGGIGITPFVSMLRQAAHDRWPRPMALIYANRTPRGAAYLSELQQLARSTDRFRLLATMTAAERTADDWEGETGRIDEVLLRAAGMGLEAPVYYLAGPPGMVEAASAAMARAGVAEDDIRSETFYGY